MVHYVDSMDGPVVNAAENALDTEDVKYVLPYVSPEDEEELIDAFEKALSVRELSGRSAELADSWFFETTVRLHCKGRKITYTGLKSPNTDWGPVIKIYESIENENIDELLEFLLNFIKDDIKGRFEDVLDKKDYDEDDIEDVRDYINSREEFIRYTSKFYGDLERG